MDTQVKSFKLIQYPIKIQNIAKMSNLSDLLNKKILDFVVLTTDV